MSKKISELTSIASPIINTDLFEVSKTNGASFTSQKYTAQDITTYVNSNGTASFAASATSASFASSATTDPAPYNNGPLSGTVTLDRNNGLFQKLTVSNDITLNPPSNGSEGKLLKLWIICGGTGRNLTMNASILIPSDSALTWPKALTTNKYYVALLQHNGTSWMLNSIVGGY